MVLSEKSVFILLLVIGYSCQIQRQAYFVHSENNQDENKITITMDSVNYTQPTLKYKTTLKNANPFDTSAKENFFFYDGAFSCLVGERKELNSFHEQSKAYVVFEMERIDLVQNGNIIKQFIHPKDFNSLNKNQQFILLSNEQNSYYFTNNDEILSTTSFEVAVQGEPYGGLGSIIWDDYATCQAYAQKSSLESSKTILVCLVHSISDRH
jgi:hypothetical protein